MPALPNVAKVLQVSHEYEIGADLHAANRYYVRYSGSAPSDTQAGTFAGEAAVGWGASLVALAHGTVHLTKVSVIDLSSDTAANGEWAGDEAGSRSGTELPASTCFITGYSIGRRYRGGHPRSYWPFGVAADTATPQFWADTPLTDFTNGVVNFFADLLGSVWSGGGTLSQVNVSYYQGFEAIENPITHRWRNVPKLRSTPVVDPVLDYLGRRQIGTQRRRNRA